MTRRTQGGRAYGWQRDVPDIRDHHLAVAAPRPLPAKVDLRPLCPPVYDQGDLGSCTANALAAAYDIERVQQGAAFLTPSRLFIYFNERDYEGTTAVDAGAQLRNGIKALNLLGAPTEDLWPYDPAQFTARPPGSVYAAAQSNEAIAYARVPQHGDSIRRVLADGRTVAVGISIYGSFESDEVANTGIMPQPSNQDPFLGGHAVLIVGYEQLNGHPHWIARNSWGPTWGDHGYFHIPDTVLTTPGLADDFWTISRVTP